MRNLRMIGLSVITLIYSGSAVAQTTTTCTRLGNSVNCRSQSQSSNFPKAADWAALGDRMREKRVRATHRKIGKLVAEGHCEAARNLALEKGMFDVAEQVPELCRH